MIPIRDLNQTRRPAVLTYTLIAVNVAIFLYQVSLNYLAGPGAADVFVQRFGVVPLHLLSGELAPRSEGGSLGSLVTPFTYMFLHGGFMHILGNMWFLHVFGDNVEDALGKGRFIMFYVLCGLAAAAAQIAIDPSSGLPLVGASGAIAGVLAGYVTLYPRARVVTLVPIFIFFHFMELPAFFFVFIWFGLQLLNGTMALGSVGQGVGGVAFFAHIGGFLAGLVLIRVLRPGPKPPRSGRRVYHVPREARRDQWGRDRHSPRSLH